MTRGVVQEPVAAIGVGTWRELHKEQHVVESSFELPFITFSLDSLVLDIGSGSGAQMQYIESKHGSTCVGIDIVPIKKQGFIVSDACHLPFRDGVFHTAYSLGVVEHIDTKKAVEESVRVTRVGGCILHSVPNMYSLHTLTERPLTDLFFRKWSVGYE